jgi:hypothetical protein
MGSWALLVFMISGADDPDQRDVCKKRVSGYPYAIGEKQDYLLLLTAFRLSCNELIFGATRRVK